MRIRLTVRQIRSRSGSWQWGYHVAILRYSCEPATYPTALLELAASMKLIHEHAKEWCVNADKIVVQGCSAGGHLAASLGVFWHEKWLAEQTGCKQEWLRPAGMLLCYPVITSGEFAHRGSFENLLRGQYTEEMLERVSLEKQVTDQTPPTFLWHTYTDQAVPVENSLMFVQALRKHQILTEFHMYPVGQHGLSTCDEESIMKTEEVFRKNVRAGCRWQRHGLQTSQSRIEMKKLQLMPDFLKRGKRGSFFIFMNRTRKKFRE